MTGLDDVIARLEQATGADQKFLLRAAFDILLPEPRKWNGFPWLNPRAEWVEWYQNWRWFEAAMRIGAYESAALLLVPNKHRPTISQHLAPLPHWAVRLDFWYDRFEAQAATPALAIVIAALKAKGTQP